ncbi:MAG: acetolactate synthase small subunit [Lachnospiraceae bacterium]|nr:acetolactate synthase small subunit [Lachnospiraceae bacterium]
MTKKVFSVLVENEAGVLSRVSGLFSRRNYNIDSLTVGVTEDPSVSRITVVASGEPETLEQIKKQVAKLEDVISVKELPAETSVSRELLLVRVAAEPEERPQVISVANIFRGNIVDVADHSMLIEMTGSQEKLSAWVRLLSQFKVLELSRTGVTSLSRGSALEEE